MIVLPLLILPHNLGADAPTWQAYRRLARRHHPDKDPGGRDKFHAIQAAYERLQAGAAGGQGTRLSHILLLLKVRWLGLHLSAFSPHKIGCGVYPIAYQSIP